VPEAAEDYAALLSGRPPTAVVGDLGIDRRYRTSAITFISVPGLVYARGGNFTFLQLVFGYLIGRIVICLLFIPSYFRRNLLTIYELLRSRFGGSVRSLAASLFIVMRTIADGVRLLLTSIVMSTVWHAFLPNTDIATAAAISVVCIGGVMLLFTTVGAWKRWSGRRSCTSRLHHRRRSGDRDPDPLDSRRTLGRIARDVRPRSSSLRLHD